MSLNKEISHNTDKIILPSYSNKILYSPAKILINIWFIIFSVFCILPILYVVAISFSKELDIVTLGYRLIPSNISLKAYEYILRKPTLIINSYTISIIVTVSGTFLSLFLTSMLAYAISRKDYRYRKITSFYIFFTMLFNGGLVPWYILVAKYLHMKDSILALILPYTIAAWFVLLMKGFMGGIPDSIIESAKIDGASEFKAFFKIILPISKPALATVGLFNVLMYWNDWWLGMLFINNEKLVPLQLMLYRIMSNIAFMTSGVASTQVTALNLSDLPNESARMAMCMLAAGPMLFIFPFFQKYFVKGLTLGAVKG
ncbi:MAG TPA: carbohydrate ABC transporter permease [Ruminiclostridium sp.]